MSDDDKPVTHGELKTILKSELAVFRTEFKQELKQELAVDIANAMNDTVETLQQSIDRLGDRLSAELARSSRAVAEEGRREIGALDDRYRDLPGRVALLERELDEHRRDGAAHGRRPRRPG